ncbi:MAG: PHP domain-containing protein, partial [Chitinispirillales bacterium]|nr:PHP domain-containing protein [Chitinispirillales bacterium]
MKEICGCIHLHTTFSDGGCDYPALIKAASSAGLDYIGVTDHMTLKGRREGNAGLRDGVLVLIGYEHNDDRNLNHYLAFGTSEVEEGVTNPQEYIDLIKKRGGIGFLAHPAEKRDFFANPPSSMRDAPPMSDTIKSVIRGGATAPPYPWTRWDAKGYDGIELWNQMSDWMEQLSGWQSVIKLFYPRRFLANAPHNLLAKWDEMNLRSFISGIGGVDAHTRKFSFGPFYYTVFPIKVELRGIRTHLYINESVRGDEAKMTEALLCALKDGRGFISNY